MQTSIIDRVVQQLEDMPQHLQWQVLEFAQPLIQPAPKGTPGSQLLRFAGSIPRDDLTLMSQAIEQDCGQVDLDEW
ncbi:MAG: hypothetical protein ACFB9N_12575 [Geitlerinemataceae cyanobacterium]